jgi:hypothetical protein
MVKLLNGLGYWNQQQAVLGAFSDILCFISHVSLLMTSCVLILDPCVLFLRQKKLLKSFGEQFRSVDLSISDIFYLCLSV